MCVEDKLDPEVVRIVSTVSEFRIELESAVAKVDVAELIEESVVKKLAMLCVDGEDDIEFRIELESAVAKGDVTELIEESVVEKLARLCVDGKDDIEFRIKLESAVA